MVDGWIRENEEKDIGEAEDIWPEFLEEFYNNEARMQYKGEGIVSLNGIPISRRDLIKGRYFTKDEVFSTNGEVNYD